VELAPFLFCCVAEASLNERRERLQQVKLACDAAKNAQGRMRHLPKPDLSPSEEQIAAEQDSIDREDIFGMFLDELGPRGQSYNDARDNPFALFLDKLADATNGVATFEAYAGRDFPDYRVCIQEAEHFADGDSELAEEILRGHVALQDMPKELRKNGSWKDQAAWVRSKAEQFRKEMIRRIEERRKEEGSP
jgi:hypothetical protein